VTGNDLDLHVRSRRLHVRRWGSASAPLLIGVPGLTGTTASFDFLGAHVGGATTQVVAVDLRGRGSSDRTPPGSYGWENHARDLAAIADELGFERFSVCGQSMGGSVAIKVAELAGDRLDAVILSDVAGRVEPGIGPVVADVLAQLDESQASRAAVDEDRAYTWTQDPYARWQHLTMPTLLLRATREMRAGAGFVIPAGDVPAFRRAVPRATVVEVDADHSTINSHPDTVEAMVAFLAAARGAAP
jgi:pimeloyl-ACP methyl ester carboxylesterase